MIHNIFTKRFFRAGAAAVLCCGIAVTLAITFHNNARAADAPTFHFSVAVDQKSQTVKQGETASYTMSITPDTGYSGTIDLSVSGCPSGAQCSFADGKNTVTISDASAATVVLQVATAGTPLGGYSITVSGKDERNGALFSSVAVSLSVSQGPGYTLQQIAPIAIPQEQQEQTPTLLLNRYDGFAEDVTVSWSVHPQAAGMTFTPASGALMFTGTSTSAVLTIAAGSGTAGSYTIDFVARSTGGMTSVQNGVTLTVGGTACTIDSCSDAQTCTASGCVADPAATSSTCNKETCYETGSDTIKAPAPDGCWKSWPACARVDVIKVRKDRQCNAWLGCKASIMGTVTQTDGTTTTSQPQCTQLGVCVQLGANGQCQLYTYPASPTPANMTFDAPADVTGDTSKIRWYSGYSSGFHFSTDANQSQVIGTYPAVSIAEVGAGGAATTDLANNGNFEELRCIGGPRDRQSCVVPSDCRTGDGVCADNQEEDGSPHTASTFPCSSDVDCKGQKTDNGTTVPYCRYLTSWGADVVCRNPIDTQWYGVLPVGSTGYQQVGFGYAPGDPNYHADILTGQRRDTPSHVAVTWKVWEDEANFQDQPAGSPRYPFYAQTKHIKEGNNFLKATIEANAPIYSGVGVPITQQLQNGVQYALSFKFKVDANSAQDFVPLQAKLGLNYDRANDAGAQEFQGYRSTSETRFQEFNALQSTTVCSTDFTTCTSNATCGGGTCVDLTQWQTITMPPVTLGGYNNTKQVFLEFVAGDVIKSTPFTFYLDDVSLKPVLNTATTDVSPTSLVVLPRSCRLYPRADSPDCQYITADGSRYKGWRGYCLDRDPRNANLCLTWWPLDVLTGEGPLGVAKQGYSGPVPLFQCLQQEGGVYYLDVSNVDATELAGNEERTTWDVIANRLTTWKDGSASQNVDNVKMPKLKLKNINSIDIYFSAYGSGDWGAIESGGGPFGIEGNSYSQKNSTYWLRADLNKLNRVRADDGIRTGLDLRVSFQTQIDDKGAWDTEPWVDANGENGVWNEKCEGDGNSRDAAFRFHFSSNDPEEAVLDTLQMKVCDDDDHSIWPIVRFVVRTKQTCNYIVQTVQSQGVAESDKAWATRVKTGSAYQIAALGIPYSADVTPFGSIAPPVPLQTPESWGPDNIVQSMEPTGLARAGIPYSYKYGVCSNDSLKTCTEDTKVTDCGAGNTCAPSTQPKYCFDAATPEPVDLPAVGTPNLYTTNACATTTDITSCQGTNAGSQCLGRPVKHCSANWSKACVTASDCGTAGDCIGATDGGWAAGIKKPEDAINQLKHVFAQGFGCWTLKTTLDGGKLTQQYEAGCSDIAENGKWDVATHSPTYGGGPCSGSTRPTDFNGEYCTIAPQISNLTVNGVTASSHDPLVVHLYDGVNASFTYSVNADQRPARQVNILWKGGNCSTDGAWQDAPDSPVTVTQDIDPGMFQEGQTYKPVICVKDNWGAIGSKTFDTGMKVE